MKVNFELIGTDIELNDSEGVVSLYERHYFVKGTKIIEYYTLDSSGNKREWEATKDPESLTTDERHRVLDYCLSSYDKDEVVNYKDLFMQGDFIAEVFSPTL